MEDSLDSEFLFKEAHLIFFKKASKRFFWKKYRIRFLRGKKKKWKLLLFWLTWDPKSLSEGPKFVGLQAGRLNFGKFVFRKTCHPDRSNVKLQLWWKHFEPITSILIVAEGVRNSKVGFETMMSLKADALNEC